MSVTRLPNGALRDFYEQHGLLLKLHLDLLYACDLACRHCYLGTVRDRPQASTDELVDVLEQGAGLGVIQVTLSGGEVFLRDDLFRIIEAARRLRYHIRVKTHGGHVTRAHAARLRELGVAAVDFSVYALDAEVHDAFTRKRGSLFRTLRGLDAVAEAGVEVTVKCPVNTCNVQHYRTLHEHFASRGIDASMTARIHGANDGSTGTCSLNVSWEDKVALEMYRLVRLGLHMAGPRPAPDPARPALCGAGRSLLYVAPDLAVYPCTAFPVRLGDLRAQSLAEIWDGSSELRRVCRSTRADIAQCQACAARPFCSYCPGIASIHSGGDWLTPPAIVCREAFARQEAAERVARGEEPPPHSTGSATGCYGCTRTANGAGGGCGGHVCA